MSAPRGEFTSRFGFIMAAAGSAVGLGNIWGFPTQTASNGGAAFVFIYLILAFCLAYPALMAELIIGRHGKANSVKSLRMVGNSTFTINLGAGVGYFGMFVAGLVLAFYGIVAGWMVAYALSYISDLGGSASVANWLTGFGVERNLLFMLVFMSLTVAIIIGGVKDGIERWCTRLMPALLIILLALIVYVMTLDGAGEGLKAYLIPDFSRITEPKLIISAMGQAFFSMSIGVGSLLIYGSYVSDQEDLPSLGRAVTLLDVGIAVMAGLLIIPAMYVAQYNGVAIYDEAGKLISEDTVIFTVLPALFDTMGGAGIFVAIAFFILMSIAALTSTISMLEVPVAYTVETHDIGRKKATLIIGAIIAVGSGIIVLNFEALFGLAVAAVTQYSQPFLGLMMCVIVGWVWHRDSVLRELSKNNPDAVTGLFWKIWPNYVRFVCPAAIIVVIAQRYI